MKIGMICFPTYGGSGVVATELGLELARRGHEVHFISYARPVRLASFVENVYFHEVEVNAYPLFKYPSYELSLTGKMLEILEYEALDILHGHYAIPHAVTGYLAKQVALKNGRKIAVVTTLHGTDITLVGLDPSFLPLVKFSIEASDGVTAVSKFLSQKTLSNYHIDKEIETIYNFVDTARFKPFDCEKYRKCFARECEKVLMHTSNFRGVKRVQDTIRILERVKKELPVKLVLIGDGPERSDCERLTRELGLQKDVSFLGKQDGLPDLLNTANLFLMPSQSESFGLAALEAMSCGIPIISSSVGGLPELNVHNQTGYIAEFGDVDQMAKYTLELLTNEKKYTAFSKNCRERAVTHFDISLIIPQYVAYYEKVLAQTRG